MWRKGNPLTLLVGMQTGIAAMENSVEIPQKNKNRTAIRPTNLTGGITHRGAYTLRKPESKETHVPQCSLKRCLQ